MSTNPRIYLDFNATAPLVSAARGAIMAALGALGNPSSIHADGRAARDLIERARNQVAALVGRPREHIVFTSGGTEGNTLGVLALAGVVERRGGARVVATTALEHPCVHGAVRVLVARGWAHRLLAVSPAGAPIVAAAPGGAAGPVRGVGLVAVSAVNHELGTVADLASITACARAAGALIHVDAVQAAGKLPLASLDADAMVLSSHKLGGPQGVGALVIALDEGLPLIEGGHQERGRRPGTENTLGIVGMGAAAAALELPAWAAVAALGADLEAGLCALPGARVHGADGLRIGGTINAAFEGALGESIVVALDLAGVSVSTGAACTSGSVQPSAVLLALGIAPARAREAVRFSLGRTTTRAEIDAVLGLLPPIVERARRARVRSAR